MTATQRMRLKLTDILRAANKHYDEGYLSLYFDVATGGPRTGSGDTLAEFIVREIRENFDGKSSRKRQVGAAVSRLERAKEVIQNAIDGLVELELGSLVNIAGNNAPYGGTNH